MAKIIELIDKYIIKQSDGEGYNPPSYIWMDNTGELIRCEDCAHAKIRRHFGEETYRCAVHDKVVAEDAYCSWADRKDNEE